MVAPARPMARPLRRSELTAPARRTRPAAPVRPLRLVDDARARAAQKRRRMRAVFILAGLLTVACLFALAVFNAMLVSGQGRIDQLEDQVTAAQAEYSANRLKVAELESPQRVVQAAQRRLGMVPPSDVSYLTPSQAMADDVGPGGRDQQTAAPSGAGSSWAAVKPYLAARP
jgi:cell division protein FtsL